MIYDKLKFLVFTLVLLVINNLLFASNIPQDNNQTFDSVIVSVARDGSGDFNCDGEADEVQINQAIDSVVNRGGGTVYIKSGQYTISKDIIISGSNLLIKGDGWDPKDNSIGTFILLKKMASLTVNMMSGNHFSNVKIKKIKMSAQRWNQKTPIKPLTDHWHFIMTFSNVDKVIIDSMWLGDNYMDIIKLENSTNVVMKNSHFIYAGHSSCYAIKCQYISMENNYFELRANSGFRTDNGNHFLFKNNIVTCYEKGGADFGIETIQRNNSPALTDFRIINNVFYDIQAAGIVITASNKSCAPYGVVIKNNLIYHSGVADRKKEIGGILLTNVNNAVIENNTIYNNRENGIWFGSDWYYPVSAPIKAIVKNNIITQNTKYGIIAGTSDTLIGGYNNVWGNGSGEYYGCKPLEHDISIDPGFAKVSIRNNWSYGKTGLKVDLHLLSEMGRWNSGSWVKDSVTSPCIDGGDIKSDYSLEPEPNGRRINIGAYGNTAEASKSSQISTKSSK